MPLTVNRNSSRSHVLIVVGQASKLYNGLNYAYVLVFTALHAMQTRSSDENSVCPSVRPSVCLSNACFVSVCDKTVERSVQIYIRYERTFSLVF